MFSTSEFLPDLSSFSGVEELKAQGAYPEIVLIDDPVEKKPTEVNPTVSPVDVPKTGTTAAGPEVKISESQVSQEKPPSFIWIWILAVLLAMAVLAHSMISRKSQK